MAYGDPFRCHTVASAAEHLQVSESTIRRLIKSGGIAAFRVGRQWRISEGVMRALVAGQEPVLNDPSSLFYSNSRIGLESLHDEYIRTGVIKPR